MERLPRRLVLRMTAGATLTGGLAGCTTLANVGSDDSTLPTCDAYVLTEQGDPDDGRWPWDVHIRNAGLGVYEVEIHVTEVSGETPVAVAACRATEEEHDTLDFGLAEAGRYRFEATLHRDDETETDSTTVSGAPADNEEVEVIVEDGEFQVRARHYDSVEVAE